MLGVLADHHATRRACGVQHARDELRELAVADHGCFSVRANIHLFQNFARGGQRLGEDGGFIGNVRGDAVQVHDGQREVFGKRAVMADDSKDAAARAVRRNSAAAIAARVAEAKAGARKLISPTTRRPIQALILCARDANDFAHEFVAERAVKIVIAAQNFDVGVADSRQAHTDQGPAGPQSRQRFFNHCDTILLCDGGKHRKNIGAQARSAGQGRAKWHRHSACGVYRAFRHSIRDKLRKPRQADACVT